MTTLLNRVQVVLDTLAAEHGADYTHIARHTIERDGRVFYSVSLHAAGFCRSGSGDTVAEALASAIAKTPFDARSDREAA